MIVFKNKLLEFQLFITLRDGIIRRKWCLENDIDCIIGGCIDYNIKDIIMAIDINDSYYTCNNYGKIYTTVFGFVSMEDMMAFKLRWS